MDDLMYNNLLYSFFNVFKYNKSKFELNCRIMFFFNYLKYV